MDEPTLRMNLNVAIWNWFGHIGSISKNAKEIVNRILFEIRKTHVIIPIKWNSPESIPEVKEGTEDLFWIAVVNDKKKQIVFLAYYQNRPLETDEDGDPANDDYLININGDPIDSVGWVDCKEHSEFDNFYTKLDFDESYKLLGWAEYDPPKFTGLSE